MSRSERTFNSMWLRAILTACAIVLGCTPIAAYAIKPASPIIFVHGLNSSSATWDALKTYLVQDLGWTYGGNLRYDASSDISVATCTSMACNFSAGDFYTIDFTSSTSLYLLQQGYELQEAIHRILVHKSTGTKITVVGHSMGGLAARAYLQGWAAAEPGMPSVSYRHDVDKLITIGTPHQGSDKSTALLYATVAATPAAAAYGVATGVGIMGLWSRLSQATDFLTSFHAPAYIELEPGSPGLSLLNNFGIRPLPTDVIYRSIVGLAYTYPNLANLVGHGDGIVTADSQNLANLSPSNIAHAAITHTIDPCASTYLGTVPTGGAFVQVHTCEPADHGVWQTIISESAPAYTDTVSLPTAVNFPSPTQYAPANNISVDISSSDVDFSWSQISGATSYRIMVSENVADLTTNPTVSTCSGCVINYTTASNSYTILASTLKSGTTYYWRVKARSAAQVGAWSTARSFVAMVPPQSYLASPNLIAPVNAASGLDSALTFSWSAVNGASSYRIVVADSPSKLPTDVNNPICSACIVNDVIASPNYTLPYGLLKPSTTYYWQVKARSLTGFGAWSSPQWSFSTAAPVVDSVSPQDGLVTAVAGYGQVDLSWSGFSDVNGIANYRVTYSTTSTPADCSAGTVLTSTGLTRFTHVGLTNGVNYYYRICATDGVGNLSAGATVSAAPQGAVLIGSLRISISPAGAPIIAGAQWKLSTEGAWRNSDDTISGLAAGNYTVQFKPITGWATPQDQTVVIAGGSLNWYDGGAYVLTSGGVAAPSNLQAYPNSDGSMSFTWSDNSNNEDYFNIYASASGAAGSFGTSVVSGVSENTVSYTVASSAFTMGQNYCFRLMAYQNASALYSYSNIACATPNIVSGGINAPLIIASGDYFQIAQKSDGTVWSWGQGGFLQTGYDSTADRNYPGPVLLSDVTKMSSGSRHTLAVKADGRVFAWGRNAQGQLGDGTTQDSSPKQVAGLAGIVAVSAGYSHSVAVGSNGTVWSWGSNTNGELGDAGSARLVPGLIAGLSGVAKVSAGEYFTVAIKNDGTVWAWGRDTHGEVGVKYSPQQVNANTAAGQVALTGATEVVSGRFHNVALKADGSVWTWSFGNNLAYATDLTDVISIAAGSGHSLGLKSDGTVWTFTYPSLTATQVPGLSNVVAISAAEGYSTAIRGDGTMLTWGVGSYGVLGNGTSSTATPLAVTDSTGSGVFNVLPSPRPFVRSYPMTLSFPTTGTDSTSATQAITLMNFGGAAADLGGIEISPAFAQSTTCGSSLAAGASCVINVSFSPTTAGSNAGVLTIPHSGTPGFGKVLLSATGVVASRVINTTPNVAGRGVLVGGGTVAYGSYVTVVAVPSPGFIFGGWGENGSIVSANATYSFQALVDRTLSASFLPQAGATGPIVTLSNSDISFGGQLVGLSSPIRVVTLYNAGLTPLDIASVVLAGNAAFSVFDPAGSGNCSSGTVLQIGESCTLRAVFTPAAVGNYTGSLRVSSNATGSPYSLPLSGVGRPAVVAPQVSLGTDGIHTMTLRSDGTLWAWGGGYAGQLGDGANSIRTTPIKIGSGENWSAVSAGFGHTVALQNDGTLWAWGNNQSGALGNGSSTPSNTPLKIGSETNWKAVSAGNAFTLAIKADGTLWAWGENQFGKLGIGTTTASLTPFQVGTATNWSVVTAGSYHSLAIRTDGTLWAWGYNSVGQLGDGTTTTQLSPMQIGTATNWAAVAASNNHTLAIRSDGSLWAWGQNSYGKLGDGTQSNRYSPVRIGIASDWASIAAGNGFSAGVRADGTLWAWGVDAAGNNVLTPTQVGTATDWLAVGAGQSNTVALKENGELWAWGSNAYGQLGNGTQTNSPLPGKVSDFAGTGYLNLGLGVGQSPSYMLDINFAGEGVVVSSPAGISCGTTCSESFPSGSAITLTVNPMSTNTFAGWWGDCSGTGSCNLTMNSAHSVGAFFAADTQPPSVPVSLSTSTVSATEIHVGWLASTDNVSVSGYKVYRDSVFVGNSSAVSFDDSGLAASTSYGYTVVACDASGNCSMPSATVPAVTANPPDIQAPSVPTALSANTISTSQVNLTWAASTDNVAVSGYKIYRDSVLLASPTATSFNNTGLMASTQYNYSVSACDAVGNCSAPSAAVSVTTDAILDIQAPSVPAGLSANAISATEAHLAWTASTDNVGVSIYKIYRDSALAGSSPVASFSDTGMSALTNYSYRVAACDAAGNCSAQSSAASVTTLVAPSLDTDSDGMSDRWELANGLNPYVNDADGDLDGDGYSNAREFAAGTDPTNSFSKPSSANVLFQDNFDNLIADDRWYPGAVSENTIYALTEGTSVLQVTVQNMGTSCAGLTLQSFATIAAPNVVYHAKLKLDGYGTTSIGLMKGNDLLNRIDVNFDADTVPFVYVRSWDGGVASNIPAAISSNHQGSSVDMRIVKTGPWYRIYVDNVFQGSVYNVGLGQVALRPYFALESCPDDIGYVDSKFDLIEVLIDNAPPIMGDIDASGRVDGLDLGRLGLAFGSQSGDANWNPDADLNGDGIVDGSDFTIFGANFGRTR